MANSISIYFFFFFFGNECKFYRVLICYQNIIFHWDSAFRSKLAGLETQVLYPNNSKPRHPFFHEWTRHPSKAENINGSLEINILTLENCFFSETLYTKRILQFLQCIISTIIYMPSIHQVYSSSCYYTNMREGCCFYWHFYIPAGFSSGYAL